MILIHRFAQILLIVVLMISIFAQPVPLAALAFVALLTVMIAYVEGSKLVYPSGMLFVAMLGFSLF